MTYKSQLLFAAAFIGAIVSLPAEAGTVTFDLSGSKNASFTIDTDATPDFLSSGVFGDQISFDNVAGIYAGAPGVAQIGFGNGLFAELNIGGTDLGFTQFAGPDFFKLVDSKPVFQPGTYSLTSIVSGSSTLTVSAESAVPEPATWAMLLIGFGATGVALRRRTRIKTTISFA